MDRFKNNNLLIVTKHGKESVLEPIFQKELGLRCTVSSDVDTDLFGTFGGEKERKLSPIETLIAKCLEGEKEGNFDFILASEGSFGNHPFIPFAAANEEMILLHDVQRKIHYHSKVLSTNTNLSSKTVTSFSELKEFAVTIGFPEHGIILKDQEKDFKKIEKEATNWKLLEEAFDEIMDAGKSVFAETDLRAMRNPKRLEVIAEAGQKLVNVLKNCCPNCQAPGFQIQKYERGLRCQLCSSPTNSIKSHTFVCGECEHTKTIEYPNGKETEDPQYCDFCNP